MDKNDMKDIQIGMVNYINTAPIHEMWKRSVKQPSWKLVEAPPSKLNSLLANDELDLGFVSCYEYAVRPEKYKILADLSISASGPVGSVFLFSKVGIQDLRGQQVLLSNQSETSVSLVKIILEEFYSVIPTYVAGPISGELADESKAVLAIGDDALRLVASKKYPIHLDLGDVWFKHTGLPFVFAVCAVQEEFCKQNEETLKQIHSEFLRCRQEGVKKLDSICKDVAPRIPMDCESCYAYLNAIEYDLGDKKIAAMERFFGYLIKRGAISPDALPLKIFG